MPRIRVSYLLMFCVAACAGARADSGLQVHRDPAATFFGGRLDPLEVVPAISSLAQGQVALQLEPGGEALGFEIRYQALEGSVAPVQLRFGQAGVSGGVLAWLCGTAAEPGPSGTPVCPPSPGRCEGGSTESR